MNFIVIYLSEFEWVVRNFAVFGLRELVSESGNEFRVDFNTEGSDLSDGLGKAISCVVGKSLQLFAPHFLFL